MARLVTFGDTALRLKPPGRERLETARDLRLHADGAESNVAVTAARLGVETVWTSKLPDTELGRRVVSELHEHGLETAVSWADPGEGRQGLTFHERGPSPRQATTIEDRGDVVARNVKPSDLPMGQIQGADMTFVGGGTPGLSSTARDTTEAVLRACEGTRVFDLDYKPGLWDADRAASAVDPILETVDVFLATEDDVREVLGVVGKPREMVHSVAAEYDFDVVVVTRSEHGAIALQDNVVHEQDALETEVVDPAGQHEAFVGGFLAKLLDEAPVDECLTYGAAAAALTRTVPGPLTAVSSDEVGRLADEASSAGQRR